MIEVGVRQLERTPAFDTKTRNGNASFAKLVEENSVFVCQCAKHERKKPQEEKLVPRKNRN